MSTATTLRDQAAQFRRAADSLDEAAKILEGVMPTPVSPPKSTFIPAAPPIMDPAILQAAAQLQHSKTLNAVTVNGNPVPASPYLAAKAQRILKGKSK